MKLKLTRLSTAATIIALLILMLFVLSVPRTQELPIPKKEDAELIRTPSVSVRDVYKKGVHTLTGSIIAPNACTLVTTRATLTGTASSSQTIALMLTMPDDSGICLQVPTRVTFSTTVTAPASLPISVSVNGTEASTTPSL